MVRYWKARKTGIDIYSGGDITVASGGTLTVAGTFAYSTVGATDFESNVNIEGNLSVAIGEGAVVFSVANATGNTVIAGTLTIGAGAGTITDAADVLTLTETNISLVGIVGVTGATTVTGAMLVTGQTTLSNGATDPALVLSGAGNLGSEGRSAIGVHVADGETFAFRADQQSVRIKIGTTVYQIPIWADA